MARSKCMVGPIIDDAGVLLTLKAGATTSALPLIQEVQTASFVSNFAENVTNALRI